MGRLDIGVETEERATWCVRVLATFWERLRGLLGTHRDDALAEVVLLAPCSSVHTWGMAYALDVCLLDREGTVLVSRRRVPPARVVLGHGARAALERPSSDAAWPAVGQRLVALGSVEDVECGGLVSCCDRRGA